MFDSIGWGEILCILVLALVIIGPERLPGVIKDVRAAIFAARRAIANARAELDGTLGEELSEFREPISQAAAWGKLGPKRALTKALFEGDDSVLNELDPRYILRQTGIDPSKESPSQAAKRLRKQAAALDRVSDDTPVAEEAASKTAGPAHDPKSAQTSASPSRSTESGPKKNYEDRGFSWEDVI